jgi:uncharacterized protein involved in propanediol utilization
MTSDPDDASISYPKNSSAYSTSVMQSVYPRIGYGRASAHHGEILQGVFAGDNARLHRGLVSLPCGLFESSGLFFPEASVHLNVEPAWKTKACKAAKYVLAFLGRSNWGGTLKINSNVPVGWGLGSSTSDVIAAIEAVADAFGQKIEPKAIGFLAVQAETASDSTMFNEPVVLFAQREGVVVEEFNGALPGIEVLGFNTDDSGIGVDTLSLTPAHYSAWEIGAFRPLMGLLRLGIETQNPRLIAQVASASADINQRILPKPHFSQLKQIVKKVESLGLGVAHSGTVVGLLFDPKDSRTESKILEARSLIAELGFIQIWRFRTENAR